MPTQKRTLIFNLIIFFFFVFSPKILAQNKEVVVNEINPYEEWIEIYKTKEGEVFLSGCTVYFHNIKTTNQKKNLNGDKFLGEEFFKKIETNATWLANDGDTVILECPWGEDIVSYGNGAMVEKPPLNKSIGRYPDGSDNLFILDKPTPNSPNSYTFPTPIVSPTSSFPTLTLTPTLLISFTPTSIPKGIYKINEVKDKNGGIISNAKIYVDGVYIHHYAPETLIFCNNCKCDTYVDCGFGSHMIELQKAGYQNWTEEIKIKANDVLEVNPVMEKEEIVSVSVSPLASTFKATPVFTEKPTPTTKTVTPTGEILGEEVGEIRFYPLEATSKVEVESKEATPAGRKRFLRKVFLGLGFLVLFGEAFSFWYTQIYDRRKTRE